MIVRPLAPDGIPLFAGLAEEADRIGALLRKLWDEGRCRPEWCFLAEEEGRAVARVCFWHLPSIPGEFHASWLLLPWTGEYLGVGRRLWEEGLGAVRGCGATAVEAAIFSDTPFPGERARFYESAGLSRIQEKWDHIWTDRGEPLPVGDRLVFRSLREVGEGAFVSAVRRVTEGTLDRGDQHTALRLDPERAARRYVAILKDLDFEPGRWLLAHRRDGALAGLVVAQRFDEQVGGIGYIGVVPSQRGNGYVDDLLAKGTRLLREAGVRSVIASIDARNAPMEAAAARAGYRRRVRVEIWRVELD